MVVVDVVLTGAGTSLWGMVLVDVDAGAPPVPVPGATVVVVVGTTPTVTDCDAAAAAYTSLPDWVAEITQEPAAMNVTTPAEIEHTDAELFAIVTVGASDASLVTCTV